MKSKECAETMQAFNLMFQNIEADIRRLNKEIAIDELEELKNRMTKVVMQDCNEDYRP